MYKTELLASLKKTRKTDHITPLFQFLHWLPIQQRIQYEISTLCYKCITDTAPSYLCDCLQLYTPSRTPRSASDSSHHTLHCWFPSFFCFRSIYREWPSPSSATETLSERIQMQPKNINFPPICKPAMFCAAVFIYLKSPFAARFKLRKSSFV